ncbi:hypothetical protein CL619_03245 [archaeon]|nr:hypothetical protein [archaeon]|tara:strand:- start:1107 stop:1472 length:366 start_codon:yes stop_codon:yes gene_type:complete
MSIIDFERWETAQGLYDVLVLDVDKEARNDYMISLYCLGVDEGYVAQAADLGLHNGISPRQMANQVWDVEIDYCYAVKEVGRHFGKQLVVNSDIRNNLILADLFGRESVGKRLFDLVEERF